MHKNTKYIGKTDIGDSFSVVKQTNQSAQLK